MGVLSLRCHLQAPPFPEPFGLDRHCLRLKAGASERLNLSFLPFQMPQAAASAPASAGMAASHKAGAGRKAIAAVPVTAPLACSLLVLHDSECGGFTYELCGEVTGPATFLQHAAKAGLEGQQVRTLCEPGPVHGRDPGCRDPGWWMGLTWPAVLPVAAASLCRQAVELQLPFPNHLLEGAKRTYAEKHPLGRDKEQLARLRADIGTSIDFAVSCDSPYFTAPSAVKLIAGAGAGAVARGGSGGSGARASSASRTGTAGDPDGRGQVAAPTSAVGGGLNLLKLGLKPGLGAGVYPARVTLNASAYDFRVLELSVTAQAIGHACALELECPARQTVSGALGSI
jgi:hypothetical protein